MKKDIKMIIGTGLVVTAMGSIPLLTHAADPSDYITNKTNAIRELVSNPNEAIFTTSDSARRNFYMNQAKRMDSSATNRLYKMSERGYTYWSPIREKGMKNGGVSNGEYIYENFYTSHMYNNGNGSDWLKNLWVEDVKITSNFKNKQIKKSDVNGINGRTEKDMKKVGVGVEYSDRYNNGGNFKGKSGRWRFNGYATDGSTSTDPLFPSDYGVSVQDTQFDKFVTISLGSTACCKNYKKSLVQKKVKKHTATHNHKLSRLKNL